MKTLVPRRLLPLLAAVSLGALVPAASHADFTINLETLPALAAQPSDFNSAGATQTYMSAGMFTLSGGVALGNPSFLASFAANGTAPNLYGTADFADPSLQPTLTLDLPAAQGVSRVQGVLFNGQSISESYTVTAFAGAASVATMNFTLNPANDPTGFANFNLTSVVPITRVTVTTPNAGTNGYDFFVDTLQVTTVPEPSTFALLAGGLALAGWGARRRRKSAGVTAAAGFGAALLLLGGYAPGASAAWVARGPGAILNGQDEGIVTPQGNNPVSGSIQAIAPVPGNVDVIYVATSNGGVWKTTNATAVTPTWTPLTDQAFPNLSLNSIALSPLDSNTVFAGSGRVSSLSNDGGTPFGLGRSTDGGTTWAVVGAGLGTRNIRSIVPTSVTQGGQVVLAGTSSGVFRSVDAGSTFTAVTSGIPVGSVSDLVGDPGVSSRFYAAISGTVYISNDTGANWATATGTGFTVVSGARVLLSVHNAGANDVVYAMVISGGGLNNLYRSANQGATWTALGVPTPVLFPGTQGSIHGAIAADRTDPNTVYLSGDRQDTPFPNANGANNFSSNIVRNVSGAYQNMVMNGANGTSPHADSRALAFDANGDLLHTNDGGIFKLTNANVPATRRWVSIMGNITPTEAHSAAYDPVSNVTLSGNQDCGSSYQLAAGATLANELIQGDGGNVAVDSDQSAHPGTSIRYTSFQSFQFFNRSTFNAANTMTAGLTGVGLNIVAGAGTGQTLGAFDTTIPFYTSFALNRITPSRMLIGTASLYESLNQGDSLTNLGSLGATVGSINANNPISYGGKNPDGTANPGAFFVGAGASLRHRTADGQTVNTVPAYPGGTIRAVVMDPQNVTHVFVLDTSSRVFSSFDDGATWINLTANLGTLCPSVRSLELFSPTASPINTVLVVGGQGGVFQMRRPDAAGTSWTVLSTGLPRVLVYDVRYDYTNNVLSAGTLGRGVWTLTGFFRGGAGTGLPPGTPTEPARAVVIDGPLVPPAAPAPELTTSKADQTTGRVTVP